MSADVFRNLIAGLLAALCSLVTAVFPSLCGPRASTLGDSHAEYLGPLLGARTETRGGWSAVQYAAVDDWNVGADAAIVYIVLGTNDGWNTPDEEQTAMTAIVNRVRAQAPDARIVWVGPPDLEPLRATDGIAHAQEAVCRELGIRWIDSRPLATGEHTPEGIHYTRDGYAVWARNILAAAP